MERYETIDWPSMKWHCHPLDLYIPPNPVLKFVFGKILLSFNPSLPPSPSIYDECSFPFPSSYIYTIGAISIYEKFHSTWLRGKALDEVMKNIKVEDESTHYIDIGPVIFYFPCHLIPLSMFIIVCLITTN